MVQADVQEKLHVNMKFFAMCEYNLALNVKFSNDIKLHC